MGLSTNDKIMIRDIFIFFIEKDDLQKDDYVSGNNLLALRYTRLLKKN